MTVSPSLIFTAPGVPVEIISPGFNVMTFEWNDTKYSGVNVGEVRSHSVCVIQYNLDFLLQPMIDKYHAYIIFTIINFSVPCLLIDLV